MHAWTFEDFFGGAWTCLDLVGVALALKGLAGVVDLALAEDLGGVADLAFTGLAGV